MKVSYVMSLNKSQPNYRVPALEKGLDVLEILSDSSEPLSLSQIADISGKSTSELFRTLNCLVERDYIVKDDSLGTYTLTLKLFELSHRHSPLDHLLSVSQKPMEDCAAQLGESCHLSVLRHQNMLQVISQIHPPRRVRISISTGSIVPAIQTVSGRMLYSVMNDESIHTALSTCESYQAMSAKDREIYWNRIYVARKTGVSTAVDESYIGIHDTAVLLGSPDIGLTAALAVTQLSTTQKTRAPQEVVEALQYTSNIINKHAGLSLLKYLA